MKLDQRNKGLYALLEIPFFYESLQKLVHGKKSIEANQRHYNFQENEVIIDIARHSNLP